MTEKTDYENIIRIIGERLRAQRISLEYKQEELAQLSGLSRSTIDRIEKGIDVKFSNIILVMCSLGLEYRIDELVPETDIGLKPEGDISVQCDSRGERKRIRKKRMVITGYTDNSEEKV